MKFDPPFQQARLVKRYKRFLADIALDDGRELTIHCPNTGSMLNCSTPGSRIWFSTSSINTGRANSLVREALASGLVPALCGYGQVRSEVRYGQENSRIDFLLSDHNEYPGQACYVEVKNVTLGLGDGLGQFPDAVSTRGSKHLRELMMIAEQGDRAVLFFCVQHSGIEQVSPATGIDPVYSETLVQAAQAGVEIMAWQAKMGPAEIRLAREIPVVLPR